MLDVTIAYSDEKRANLLSWWCGQSQSVAVYWRVIEFKPDQDEAQFRADLFQLWKEKDDLLDYYNQHRHFPNTANNNKGDQWLVKIILNIF